MGTNGLVCYHCELSVKTHKSLKVHHQPTRFSGTVRFFESIMSLSLREKRDDGESILG